MWRSTIRTKTADGSGREETGGPAGGGVDGADGSAGREESGADPIVAAAVRAAVIETAVSEAPVNEAPSSETPSSEAPADEAPTQRNAHETIVKRQALRTKRRRRTVVRRGIWRATSLQNETSANGTTLNRIKSAFNAENKFQPKRILKNAVCALASNCRFR